MSDSTTGPRVGQDSTDPSTDSLTLILREIRAQSSRLTYLEERFDYLDRDVHRALDAASLAAPDAELAPSRVPSMAITSNGRRLVSVTYFEGIDISDRATWTGVYLSEAEGYYAQDGLIEGADNVAARIAGALLKASHESEDGGSNAKG